MSFDALAVGPQRVAIIGGGISGLAAAYLVAPHHAVSVFEAAPKLGGPINVTNQNAAARTENSIDLAERGGDIGEVLEHLNGEHGVERSSWKREIVEISLVQINVHYSRAPLPR